MYDLIIIGGGPAGVAAGVYAGRKKLKTLLITDIFGGQSTASGNIENWIGIERISGFEFAKILEKHVRMQEGVEIKMPDKVVSVKEIGGLFEVATEKGGIFSGKTIVIASGGRRRHLNIPGEDNFIGKGVAFCSTCDAPIFKNKPVAVVGGGNAGIEAVIDLLSYADKIYLINRKPEFEADPIMVEKINKSSKIVIINNAEVREIVGDQLVSGLKYFDKNDNQIKNLEVEGIFVEIGSVSNSEIVKNLVETNDAGKIIIDHKTGATSEQGIFAAGDVTDEIYKQNNISAGDGVIAALSAYNYLLKNKKL